MTDPPVTATDWIVEHHRGSAAAFHGRELPDPFRRLVWWFEVDRPAVVLGSTQRSEVVDAAAAAASGVEVVRRRSGGGAVWVSPGAVTWIDVLVPAGDQRWVADVGRSAHWLGEAWARTLEQLGHPGAEVHRGRLVRSPWSDLVCFAGLGPGEVTLGGRKVVGLSQRRTRAGARFQCAVLHAWDPASLLAVLALSPADRALATEALAEAAVGLGAVAPADLVAAFVAELSDLR